MLKRDETRHVHKEGEQDGEQEGEECEECEERETRDGRIREEEERLRQVQLANEQHERETCVSV